MFPKMLVTPNLYDSRTGVAGVFKVNQVYTIHMYSCFVQALSHKTCGRTDKQICSGVYRVVPENKNVHCTHLTVHQIKLVRLWQPQVPACWYCLNPNSTNSSVQHFCGSTTFLHSYPPHHPPHHHKLSVVVVPCHS